nr:MAG TPA: hypothetical protein [Caudoviricetes sp.]
MGYCGTTYQSAVCAISKKRFEKFNFDASKRTII